MDIQYIGSRYMPADIFMKFYPGRKEEDWVHHRSLINILHKDEVPTAAGAPGNRFAHRAEQAGGDSIAVIADASPEVLRLVDRSLVSCTAASSSTRASRKARRNKTTM